MCKNGLDLLALFKEHAAADVVVVEKIAVAELPEQTRVHRLAQARVAHVAVRVSVTIFPTPFAICSSRLIFSAIFSLFVFLFQSCLIELLLALLAAWALPVIREVLEGYAVMLCRIIHIAADGADVFAGGFLLLE